jgi:hypothetical protein
MDQPNVQQLLFQHIKNNLPPHLSLVDEIAELLNISNDSAYRRIRGEKGISFDEIRTLCTHFKISLDQYFHINSESVIFTGRPVDNLNVTLETYLKYQLSQMQFWNSFQRKEVFWFNKDILPFHHYGFPELAAFKFFFWNKTILQAPLFGKKIFQADEHMDTLLDLGVKVYGEYNKLPSNEIWNVENINSTLSQIEYYAVTKVFESNEEVVRIYESLEKLIDHIEKQAEAGYKFAPENKFSNSKGAFKLFVNEFIIGNNSGMAFLDDLKISYINHSVIDFMWTKDASFSEHQYQFIQNMIRKSTLISDVGEKERSRFFNGMRERIHEKKKTVRI